MFINSEFYGKSSFHKFNANNNSKLFPNSCHTLTSHKNENNNYSNRNTANIKI